MKTSNADLADLLRSVATALTLSKANQFQIRAYENAADSIEHSTSEIKDLWEEGRLDEIPGLGEKLRAHLDEFFKTGKVKHFEAITKKFPNVLYEYIKIPGVGPKTALDLSKLNAKTIKELDHLLKSGKVSKVISPKTIEKVIQGIEELSGIGGRMLLPYAFAQAEKILGYLKKGPGVKAADPLGSLRRMVSTIGDLDFAAASENPEAVVDYFVKMPGIKDVINQGSNKATVVLTSGMHVDLLVGKPESYGALLQHFTGGKNHNIKLRTFALKKGLSLSEDGVTRIKPSKTSLAEGGDSESRIKGETIPCKTEEDLYRLLGMDTPAPEIREDAGEIEAALNHQLPDLIEFKDIRGDLHLHSNFPIEHPSHGPGANPIREIVKKAKELGYEYVGISDHPPAHRTESKEGIIKWVETRTKEIEKVRKEIKGIKVLNGLEIDILPDGNLSVPDEALSTLDYCIAGIHSQHRSDKETITDRLLKALSNRYVDIISHPTGRLLNGRGSYDADWDKIFEYCGKNKKVLEINGYPNRLDLRDDLVREALKFGVKFVIDTDAHEISQMDNMLFGVAVGRRGWAAKKDIVNAWDWKKFAKWFEISA